MARVAGRGGPRLVTGVGVELGAQSGVEQRRVARQTSSTRNIASRVCFSPTSRGEEVRFWQLLKKFGIGKPDGNLMEHFLISKIFQIVVF